MSTMNPLKVFMRLASAPEQEELAQSAGTTRPYLYRLANSGANYARSAKAELAAKLERASHEVARKSKGRLPKLYRTDLNDTCRACPYAQRCLGERAIASHFDVVQHTEEPGNAS